VLRRLETIARGDAQRALFGTAALEASLSAYSCCAVGAGPR
jgi:hypothetical protein